MENNYDKQVLISRKLFMNYDQSQMVHKFGLEHDDSYLYLTYLNDRYRINRSDGSIERRMCTGTAYRSCMEYNAVMTIYDMLCCSSEKPTLSGEWCPVASLQVTHSSPSVATFTDKSAIMPQSGRKTAGRSSQRGHLFSDPCFSVFSGYISVLGRG